MVSCLCDPDVESELPFSSATMETPACMITEVKQDDESAIFEEFRETVQTKLSGDGHGVIGEMLSLIQSTEFYRWLSGPQPWPVEDFLEQANFWKYTDRYAMTRLWPRSFDLSSHLHCLSHCCDFFITVSPSTRKKLFRRL